MPSHTIVQLLYSVFFVFQVFLNSFYRGFMKKFLFLATLATQSLFADPCFDDTTNCGCNCCGNGIELGVDWLYWKAEQSQMEVASNVNFTTSTTISATPITPRFDYSSGVRVYGNYNLDSCWSLGASFVYLPTKTNSIALGSDTSFIVINQNLFPIFTILDSTPFDSLNTRWKSDLYYADIPLKYTFRFPCNIAVEPYVGLRGFWNNQKLSLQASGNGGKIASTMSEKIRGVGLLGGIQASWEFCNGFMLIAKLGSSLVYTRINNDNNFDVDMMSITINNSARYNRSISSFESFIGLAYRFDLCGVCGQVRLGWENNLFFNTNQFTITTGGNLNVQGLTLGGSIYF